MSLHKDKVNKILIKIKRGNIEAIKELHAETYNHLKLVAFNYLADCTYVEDVLNDAYYRAYSYIHSVNTDYDGYNWLCKIVQNLCYQYNSKHCYTDFPGRLAQNKLFYEMEDILLEKSQLYRAIGALDLNDQQIIYLRFWEGLSLKEIAGRRDMKKSTVNKRIVSILKKLQQEFN